MDDIEIAKARKQNIKIYSLYRAISLDLIFYYAIEFLFLTQVKHISSSDVVLSSSMYAIFMIIFQIPASTVIDKLGTRECTILANIFNSIFIILIILCDSLPTLILAQFISAICFSLKDISDVALIKYSIPKTEKEGEIFSKLEGKGLKNYFIFNSVSAILAGFLYVINPYIPLILSFTITIISIVLSCCFKEIEIEVEEVETKTYMKDLIQGVKLIMKSQRLRSLFLYSGISWGIIALMGTYRASLLVDIGTPEQVITIIAAIVGVASSIGSREQLNFHNLFKNKSLSVTLLIIIVSIFVAGITGVVNISYSVSLFIIVACFCAINFSKGVSMVITKRYLGNFADEKILTQIYAIDAISKNAFRAIISLVGAYLLKITNTANSLILMGIMLSVTVLGLVSYMKTRLGLKPEEYSENELPKM